MPARDNFSHTFSLHSGYGWSVFGSSHRVTHVLLRSAYHRGQIASQVRAGGEQPASTDFIHAARQSLIE